MEELREPKYIHDNISANVDQLINVAIELTFKQSRGTNNAIELIHKTVVNKLQNHKKNIIDPTYSQYKLMYDTYTKTEDIFHKRELEHLQDIQKRENEKKQDIKYLFYKFIMYGLMIVGIAFIFKWGELSVFKNYPKVNTEPPSIQGR